MATAPQAAPNEKVLEAKDDVGGAQPVVIDIHQEHTLEKANSDATASSDKQHPGKEEDADVEVKGSSRDYIVSMSEASLGCLVNIEQRIFFYATHLDWFLYAVAVASAIIVGAALPLMTLVFGSATSSFNANASGSGNPQAFQSNINYLVLFFVYLFVGRFVLGYVGTLCICIAAARTTNNLRKAFLDSLLRKEISHFDLHSNGSAATQVTTSQCIAL